MRNRYFRVAALVSVVLLLLASAFGLGRITLHEAKEASTRNASNIDSPIFWTVKEEQIGRTINYSATISSIMIEGPLSNNEGIITAIPDTDSNPKEGTPILEINLRKIVIGQGGIPSFRDLTEGDIGADVQQLRNFLCRNGFNVCAKNETFTTAMTKAVKDWQKTLGNAQTGTVLKGDILWFPELPTHVKINNTFKVGSMITVTDRPIVVRSEELSASIKISEDQLEIIPAGSPFTLEGKISGIVGQFTNTPVTGEETSSSYTAPLLAVNGIDSICTKESVCEQLISNKENISVNIKIQTIPQQTGLGVPTSAITSSANGSTYVTMENGKRKPVTIIAHTNGITLIEGLEKGATIRLNQTTP